MTSLGRVVILTRKVNEKSIETISKILIDLFHRFLNKNASQKQPKSNPKIRSILKAI